MEDHLGNSRIVANQHSGVVQSTQYYPFGMALADGSGQTAQPYKYNGKELYTAQDLNLYDYSARHMDPALGRFTTMDPLAEKYYAISPYAYCANNPMRFVDPTGMFIGDPLIPRFGRKAYGNGVLNNAGAFIYNTVAAITNVPIDVVNSLVDETKFIADNGVGTYLSVAGSAVVSAIEGEVSYRANTPISQQAADLASAASSPEVWENVAAGAVMMAVPVKSMGRTNALKASGKVSSSVEQGINVLSKGDAKRIENAATRINKPIHVVGSRASGKAGAFSDWDYVIEGGLKNSKEWSKIKNSLPGARSTMENTPRNIDIHKGPVRAEYPHITIYPR